MNTILLRALAGASLLFVTACASHEPAPVTTSTTTTQTREVPIVPTVGPATTTTETQQVHTY
jgi:hypothetical protein